ncbi:MAG: 30S ribosome-binding factor RbfA [Magnetospirillum sp.]|nr:30S ribosome-binding factor RbfA [Magnetospirillum sp.]
MPRGQKPPSQRQLRVGEELRHTLANVIERGDFRDPDLVGRGITVTEVRVSPDLKNATVFVVPLGGGDVAPLLAGLKRAKAYLRHEIATKVQLRAVPELRFQPDTTFDEASRLDSLLRSPDVRRDLEADDAREVEDGRAVDAEDGRDDGE